MARSEKFLGDVLVLGLGSTGQALCEYLLSLGSERVSSISCCSDTEAPVEIRRSLGARGVRLFFGKDVEGSYDLCISSPGIAPSTELSANARAASAEFVSEPEFAWRESPERWLAITGTNGKTTTTELTTSLLRAAGMAARSVGNIGRVVTGCLADRGQDEWFVAELSSFQLAESPSLAPRAAVLLNITPDHISWHGSMEAYAEAKGAVFRNMGPEGLAIVSPADTWCQAIISRLQERGMRTLILDPERDHGGACAAHAEGGMLTVRIDGSEHELVRADELAIRGAHNVANALAAASLALEAGASVADVRAGLLAFRPLEHRVEPCGTVAGVFCVNDSKATNVDSVIKALGAFEAGSIVLLAGGHDKMTDISELCAMAAERCRAVVCFGEAGDRFERGFAEAASADGPAVVRAAHLADAVEAGLAQALPGDTLLLSPACSSFDEFKSFEERGARFKELIAELAAQKER